MSHPLNDRLQHCFREILLDQSGKGPSQLVLASRQQDSRQGIAYYSLPEEMAARAFEAFVEDARPDNRFLVCGTRNSEEARLGLYPEGEQRQRIHQAFSDYFIPLGQALRRTRGH